MLIVHNIDPKLLAELLVTAAHARSKAVSGRGQPVRPVASGETLASPAREPRGSDDREKTHHVRVAR